MARRKSIRSVSRIEAARRKAGLRQQDLADLVRVSRALIGFVEGGYVPAGPIRTRLADVLAVDEHELWPEQNDERPPDQPDQAAPSKNPAGRQDMNKRRRTVRRDPAPAKTAVPLVAPFYSHRFGRISKSLRELLRELGEWST